MERVREEERWMSGDGEGGGMSGEGGGEREKGGGGMRRKIIMTRSLV